MYIEGSNKVIWSKYTVHLLLGNNCEKYVYVTRHTNTYKESP